MTWLRSLVWVVESALGSVLLSCGRSKVVPPPAANLPMIWAVAASIVLLNVPFGYWRSGLRKFSVSWFAAVHAPVPLAVAARFVSGLGFQWRTLPLFVTAFFGGQWLGGRLRTWREKRAR